MTIRFLPEAELELEQALAFCKDNSPGFDQTLALAMQQALNRIEERPLAWQLVSKRTRRYRLTRFPYGVIYAPLTDEIVILAVMHLHRNPSYWLDRLKQI